MRCLLILILTTISIVTHAQYDMKYGKVDTKDLEMQTYEADPEAAAVVLGEEMIILFAIRNGKFMLTYHYHTRIKILNKKGLEKADIEIPYWSNRRSERIAKIKAQTLNLKDGKVVKTEVEKKDFFIEKKDKYRSVEKFAFPAVEVGSILEYYYELDSDYYISINDFFFQQDIPVAWSSYKVRIYEAFEYRCDIQGMHPVAAQSQGNVTLNQAEGLTGREYYWLMTDIPALKEEPYITSMYDYYAGVRMRLGSFEPHSGFHQHFIGTWFQMNALYYEEVAEKNYLKNNYSDAIWDDAEREIKDGMKDAEKMEALYSFVKKHIKHNGIKEIDPEHTADYCYKEKEGSNSEINLALLSLLQKANIEAYPLLICTRDHHKPMNFLPYLYQFNQTLVVVIIDKKTYYLDASNENYPMETLPPNDLNVEGWIIVNKEQGRWIPIFASQSTEVILPTMTIAKDGTVEGSITVLSKGYAAYNAREMIREKGKDEYLQSNFLATIPNSTIENHNFLKLEDINEELKQTMDIVSNDMVEVTGNLIYFDPFVKATFVSNPFKTEKREIPVDMPYGINKQYILKIIIPEGYSVEALPEAAKILLPNDGGSFLFAVLQNGNEIQVVSKVRLEQTYFKVEEYEILRQFVDLIIEKQKEQIILSAND
jgi:hypothetical protein